MTQQGIPLFGDPQPVPRSALSKRDRPPGVAIVYVTDDGQYHRIDGGRQLSVTESLWTPYRYRFDVDVTDHEIELVLQGNELPSSEPAFSFIANVEVGFRVVHPETVVQRKVTDGYRVVRTRVLELIRQICYGYEILRVLDAENAVNGRFSRPVQLIEGIEVYRCFTKLSLDAGAAHHAARMRSVVQGGEIKKHQQRSEIDDARHTADVRTIHTRAETDDLRRRVEAIASLNIDEQRLLEMYVAQNPGNAAEALNLLNAKEQARHERAEVQQQNKLKRYEFLLTNGLLRGPQATAVTEALIAESEVGTPTQQAAPASGASSFALPAAFTGPALPSPATPGTAPPPSSDRGAIALGPVTPPAPAAWTAPAAPAPPAPAPRAPAQPPAPARRPAARPPVDVPSTQLKLPQPPAGTPATTHRTAPETTRPSAPATTQPAAPAAPPVSAPGAVAGTGVQPIYLAVDESASAGRWGNAIETGLTGLLHGLARQSAVTAGLQLAVLGFAGAVRTLVPLGPALAAAPPRLAFTGAVDFAAVFTELIQRIPDDVAALKQAGHRVNRPIVFMLCTARPPSAETWLAARNRLADRATLPAAPNVVACGVADVDAPTLRAVATRPEFGFLAAPGIDPAVAVDAFWQSVGNSLISTGMALIRGDSSLSIKRPDGFQVANDEI
ncbi:hypothetical protein ACTI_65970 [Actinoplanes sp. OR16]|uniref:vWA domain-containing protein n=1 Tax=Actinoplanes sp. OR16 TaxID=946334 RepID=UPI000F7145A0|nr:hypothetical protein [Actinoplanes sp. OR16]BBH69912.1 hypothetical protein ACTI_65970 [Actinoplanes sp. OR16]